MNRAAILISAAVAVFALGTPRAQQLSPSYFGDLHWRNVGPPRSGYVSVPAGVPGDSTTYYAGMPEGGVWKTTSGGVTWKPIFDDVHVASVGAVAVAPSDPKIVYVGTGNQSGWSFTTGKGVYKSTDAGKTWTNIGLTTSEYIGGIVVDPKNADNVLVAVIGPRAAGGGRGAVTTAPQAPVTGERGVYRTTNGGRTWARVLPTDGSAGASDVYMDYYDPQIVFALLTAGAALPTAPALPQPANGPGTGVFKSTDGGATWTSVGGRGLPDGARISAFAVSSGTHGQRLYGVAAAGGGRGGGGGGGGRALYRSDDGGDTWVFGTCQLASAGGNDVRRSAESRRRVSHGHRDLSIDECRAERRGVLGCAEWRGSTLSLDRSHEFEADDGRRGSRSRDFRRRRRDLHAVLRRRQRPVLSRRHRLRLSVSRVRTATGFGHRLRAEPDGLRRDPVERLVFGRRIRERIPDRGSARQALPLHAGLVPRAAPLRSAHRSGRRALSTHGRRSIRRRAAARILAARSENAVHGGAVCNVVDRSRPDVEDHQSGSAGRPAWPDAEAAPGERITGVGAPAVGGSIQSLAVSPVTAGVIWVGTSNALVQLTRDEGKTWTDVTPPNMPGGGINVLAASHANAGTAYVALLSRDNHPHIYRTSDYGKTWQEISTGLADGAAVRVVREDPVDQNLLYAGTVTSKPHVSFDRGDHWQSMQLNLPTTVVSDMTVKDNDLVISTYGRGFWILDDVAPLRQIRAAMAANTPAFLYKPSPASRARWDNTQDTPLPPEMKVGSNPPEGAIVDYYLAAPATGPMSLSFSDSAGKVIREFTNVPPPVDNTMANVPDYWLTTPIVLSPTAGMHRVAWDLRYADPPTLNYGYSGNLLEYREYTLSWHALPGQTPRTTLVGPMVLPGTYTVKLTVNGRSYTQPLTIVADPRVSATPAALAAQFQLEQRMVAGIAATYHAVNYLDQLRTTLTARTSEATGKPAADQIAAAIQTVNTALGPLAAGPASFGTAHRDLGRRLNDQLVGDVEPTASIVAGVDGPCQAIDAGLAMLRQLQETTIRQLNATLRNAGLGELPAWTPMASPACGK